MYLVFTIHSLDYMATCTIMATLIINLVMLIAAEAASYLNTPEQ